MSFFLETVNTLGKRAQELEGDVRALTPEVSSLDTPNLHEVNAQLMLAVRALEEAQDRLTRAFLVARS